MRATFSTALAVAIACTSVGAQSLQYAREFSQTFLTLFRGIRSEDGYANNRRKPHWGQAGIPLRRLTTAAYDDGVEDPRKAGLPGARAISNGVVHQIGSIPNQMAMSDWVWQWGQFVDHDIDLTPEADPAEPFPIPVPLGDMWFDPGMTGSQEIPLNRSVHVMKAGVRQQINQITAFIDASNVYGSDAERALELRTLDGTGRMKTSAGDLLPFNVNGFPNAPTSDASFFLAGDVRANEQVGLTAVHTLFVREHNYWADNIDAFFTQVFGSNWGFSSRWRDETLYQMARVIVAAEMQSITYNEFLQVVLGPGALPEYSGYRRRVNPGIRNLFSTSAYRFGHSMLSSTLLRMDASGDPIAAGHLSLSDAFFAPVETLTHGIDVMLRGLAFQQAQEVDSLLVEDVRNMLFGPPGSGGLDLASLNIQRGREHGLPGYNQVRMDLGLPPANSFADITSNPILQGHLAAAYGDVDLVDSWVGGLAEDHVPGAMVGELNYHSIRDQFLALRDGDRFWYQNYLPRSLQRFIEKQTLAVIIKRNTSVGDEMSNNPWFVLDS